MTTFTDDDIRAVYYNPPYVPLNKRPVFIEQYANPAIPETTVLSYAPIPFLVWPFFGSLLFPNVASDCRDHCANERTFLSWLRLSTYLAVVAVAIVISFHLKQKPTPLELRISLPVGIVFWVLSLASLASGLANYIRTITRYSRRQALVQSGWKTQIVFTVVATSIVASCVLFLSVNADSR